MFRITQDPSSGRLVLCLAKNYKNVSIVSVDMGKVSVMAAYAYSLCTIKIIKYLKVFQHVSDHRGSIIRENCTVLG